MKKLLCAVSLLLSTQSVLAETVTIDFESLATTAIEQNFPSYSEDGYNITSSVNAPGAFLAWGVNNQFFSGSTAIGSAYPSATITLTRHDNNPFNFTSIDVETLFTRVDGASSLIAPANITFNGITSSSGLVTQTISISPSQFVSELTTFEMIGFNNVASVSWLQGSVIPNPPFNIDTRHQFDNIVVSTNEVSAVPAPAALWLFAAGLPLIAFNALRKQIQYFT